MITCPHCGAAFNPFPRRGSKPDQIFDILRMSGDWVNAVQLTEALYQRPHHPNDERTMRVHISHLKRALVDKPWRIESGTRHTALGYRLVALDAPGASA